MSRILWGRATSVNVQKVMWVLAELGIAHERRDAGGAFGWPEALEGLNPNRRIPVWQDGDLVLWESHAILRHLGAAQLPPGPLGDQWMEYVTSTVQPAFLGVFYQKVRFSKAERDEAALAKYLADLETTLDVVEGRLARARWLGDAFSVADIALGAMMYRYFDMDMPHGHRPGLARWVAELQERPAYRDIIETSYEALRAVD
ncbi:MAG: glutathione S-transferase family protein [Pseudomonadota bacterium]